MNSTEKRKPFFERVKTALEEGLQYTRGEISLRTYWVPSRPPAVSAAQIVRLRRRLRLSQGLFAQMLNVSPGAVRSWERGERKPSQAALRLLQIIAAEPAMVGEVLGVPLGQSS